MGEFRGVTRPELAHGPAAVDFHRYQREPEFVGDLLVEHSGHDQTYDFPLAIRQLGGARTGGRTGARVRAECVRAVQRVVHRLDEFFGIEGFGEETVGPVTDGLDDGLDIPMGGQENGRHIPAKTLDLGMNLQPCGAVAKLIVKNQAGRNGGRSRIQQRGGATEGSNIISPATEQALDAVKYRLIVIQNENQTLSGVLTGDAGDVPLRVIAWLSGQMSIVAG